ncbi:hypothetical protein ACFV23_04120 [Streptomyces sp. NPDC059627]
MLLSTPLAALLVCGSCLRGGRYGSARGVASLQRERLPASGAAGATSMLLVRGDSALYRADVAECCLANWP